MSTLHPTFIGHLLVGLATAFNGVAWLVLTFVSHLKAEQQCKENKGTGRNDHRALSCGYQHNSCLPLPYAPRLSIDPLTPFPKKMGETLIALALWVEGVLLTIHLSTNGLSMPSVGGMHFILTLSVYGGALAATATIFIPMKVFVNLVLSVSLIFQGTWLVAIGFILQYGPSKMWLWWAENGMTLSIEDQQACFTLTSLMAAWLLLCIMTVALMLWDLIVTLNHCSCNIKVLLPLIQVPGQPACFKEQLSNIAAASQTEEVLLQYECIELMKRSVVVDVDVDVTKEAEANNGADEKSIDVIADVPALYNTSTIVYYTRPMCFQPFWLEISALQVELMKELQRALIWLIQYSVMNTLISIHAA